MDEVSSDKENKVVEIHEKQNSKRYFDWKDPLHLEDLLSEEEKLIRDTANDYAQNKLMPRVEEAFLNLLRVSLSSVNLTSGSGMDISF